MIPLYHQLDRETAELYSLVLNAAGIGNRIIAAGAMCRIEVPEAVVDTAITAIERYKEENPPPATGMPEAYGNRPSALAVGSAAAVAMMLLVVHLAVVTSAAPQDYLSTFGADARRILAGEWFRCATALLLHADAAHLAGNLVGLMIFGSVVCAIAGNGIGWLMIVGCGIAGNLVNAFAQSAGHLSVGASTSVFGALGILCAIRAARAIETGSGWRAVGLLLGAGVALLAFLGTGARSDLGAHLFGFGFGVLFGIVYHQGIGHPGGGTPLPRRLQIAGAIAAAGTLVAAWLRGAAT